MIRTATGTILLLICLALAVFGFSYPGLNDVFMGAFVICFCAGAVLLAGEWRRYKSRRT